MTPADPDPRLLADLFAIERLKAAYCAAVDGAPEDAAGAARALADIFAEDVTCDFGFGVLAGAAAAADWLVASIGGSRWMWHSIHTPAIDVAGDTARGNWTVTVRSHPRDAAAATELHGRYRDGFRRTPGGWRIAAVRLDIVGDAGRPQAQGASC